MQLSIRIPKIVDRIALRKREDDRADFSKSKTLAKILAAYVPADRSPPFGRHCSLRSPLSGCRLVFPLLAGGACFFLRLGAAAPPRKMSRKNTPRTARNHTVTQIDSPKLGTIRLYAVLRTLSAAVPAHPETWTGTGEEKTERKAN